MKKVLAVILTVALMMSLGAVTALAADPPYNGDVAGVITTEGANFSGTLTGDYNLTFTGQATGGSGNITTFAGTITGDISGTVTGTINAHGLDSLYGVIDLGSSYTGEPVRIVGSFLQSGIDGDFAGSIITGPEPAPVTSLTIQSSETTLAAGSSMQMTAVTVPAGPYSILWSVYVNDREKAWIDQTGMLHGLKNGSVIVIANTLDPTLATTTKTITIVDPETEVQAAIDPTYTIVIPAAVNLGTLQKGVAVTPQTFNVSAQDVLIEAGKSIKVKVASSFLLKSGSAELAYQLLSGTDVLATGGTFATFTGVGTQDGEVRVPSTSGITTAGIYRDTMVFSISYE